MGTQSAASTKLGRAKLGSARALWSSRSSEHRRGVAAGAEPPRLSPQPPAPGTGGRGHRPPAPRPGAAAAGGHRRGHTHARGCAEPVPLFPPRQGREKPPARDRRGGRDGGLGRAQLVPFLESQQWVLLKDCHQIRSFCEKQPILKPVCKDL